MCVVELDLSCNCCVLIVLGMSYQRFLSGQRMTEAGAVELISEDEEDAEEDMAADIKLPGVHRGIHTCVECLIILTALFPAGDMSSRRTRPEIRVKSLQFSPTGDFSHSFTPSRVSLTSSLLSRQVSHGLP